VKTDHRADIWALCSVIYECIAGRPAIEGDTYSKLLLATTRPEVTPLDESEELASLWRILELGLREDPAERFQSVYELRACLAQWLDEDEGVAHGLRGGLARRGAQRSHGRSDSARRYAVPFESETRPVFGAAFGTQDTIAMDCAPGIRAA